MATGNIVRMVTIAVMTIMSLSEYGGDADGADDDTDDDE